MKRLLLMSTVTVLALAAAPPSAAADRYIVYTRDGHHFVAEARPRIEGLQAYVRLMPGRQLAVIQEELIDWPRTEAANAPGRIAVPSDATLVHHPGPGAAPAGAPIVHTITGTPVPPEERARAADPQAAPKGEAPPETAGTKPAAEASGEEGTAPAASQAAIAEERRQALRQRLALQEEIARNESVDASPAGDRDDRAAYLARLRETLEAVDRKIADLDRRAEQADQPR